MNLPNHLSLSYANKRLMLSWQRPLNSQGTHQDVNSYIVFVSRKDTRDWQKLAELQNFNYCVPQMYWNTSVAYVIGVVASKDIHVSPMATVKLPFHGDGRLDAVSVDLLQEVNGSFEVTDHYMVEEDCYKTLTYILSVVPMDVKYRIIMTKRKRFGTCTSHFYIGSALTKMIQMSKDKTGISNVELHLRFCEYDLPLRPCKDCVPECVIRFGEHKVTYVQKANGMQSNVHRPLDITKECLLDHQLNIITVEFSPMEIKKYCMFITVVKRVEVRSIVQRLRKNMPSIQEARHYIQDKLQSDNSGVQSTSFKAKLICPIGQTRLVTPCRGDSCSHILCMEAETLIRMNEGKSVKKCFICQKPYSNIVLDKLFLLILKKVPTCVTEVEFKPDGSWRYSNNGTDKSALTIDKEDNHPDLLEDDTDFDSENDDWLESQSCDETFFGSSTRSITSVPEVLTKLQYKAEDCSAIKCDEKTKAESASEIEKEVVGVRPIQMFANSCWPVSTSAANAALLAGPSRYNRKRNILTANTGEITSLCKQTPTQGSKREAIKCEQLLKSTETENKDELHAASSGMVVFETLNSGLDAVSVDLLQEVNGSFEVTDHYMVEEDCYKTLTYILSVVPMDAKYRIIKSKRKRFGTCTRHFYIGSALTKMIQMSKDKKGISNVELHLRFCEYDLPLRPCKDCVPECVIRLGEHKVTYVQKANGQQSNVHRPLNITKECLLDHQLNIITVEFSPMEIKKYCMFITVVKRVEVRSIVQQLRKGMPSIQEARLYIQDKLQSDNSAVQSTSFKAKLICPIGQSRLVTPCRGDRCSHIICMEAETLIRMNEGKSVKKCFICQTPYSTIVVDKLFLLILMKVPPCVTEVEFQSDGSWSYSNNGSDSSSLTVDKEDNHADLLEVDTDFENENDDWLEIQNCDETFPENSTESITSVPEVLTKLQYKAEDCSAIKCGEKTKAESASEIEKEVVGVRPIQMFANRCWPVSTYAANAALLAGPSRNNRKRNILTANTGEISSLVKQTPTKGSKREAIKCEQLLKSTETENKDELHAASSGMEVFKTLHSTGKNNKAKQMQSVLKQDKGKQFPTRYYKKYKSWHLDKLISNTFKCSSCAEEFPLTKMYEKSDTRVCTDCALKEGVLSPSLYNLLNSNNLECSVSVSDCNNTQGSGRKLSSISIKEKPVEEDSTKCCTSPMISSSTEPNKKPAKSMKAGCLSTSTSESVLQNMTHGFIEEKVLNIVEKCSKCAAEISFKKVLSISNNPSDCGYKQGVLSLSLFNRFKAEGMESASDIWNKNEASLPSVPEIVTELPDGTKDGSATKGGKKTLAGNTTDIILDASDIEKKATVVRPLQILVGTCRCLQISTAYESAKDSKVHKGINEKRNILAENQGKISDFVKKPSTNGSRREAIHSKELMKSHGTALQHECNASSVGMEDINVLNATERKSCEFTPNEESHQVELSVPQLIAITDVKSECIKQCVKAKQMANEPNQTQTQQSHNKRSAELNKKHERAKSMEARSLNNCEVEGPSSHRCEPFTSCDIFPNKPSVVKRQDSEDICGQ